MNIETKNDMNRFHLPVIFAAALALAACTNDNEPATSENGPVAAQVNAGIYGALTRASGTEWSEDDEIGITATSQTKTQYTNIAYRFNGTSFEAEGDGIYFQDINEVTFNAYYPFSGQAGTSAGTVGVSTDKENQTSAKQPGIDFLFASGAKGSKAAPVINFTGDNAFRHCMSRITLTLKEGADIRFAYGSLTSYSLKNLYLDGTFDTGTGRTNTNAGAGLKSLDISLSEITADDHEIVSSVILLPQEIADGKISLTVTVAGQTYSATLTIPENKQALEAGNNYTWPVTVSKTGLSVGQAEIKDWTPVNGGGTTALM